MPVKRGIIPFIVASYTIPTIQPCRLHLYMLHHATLRCDTAHQSETETEKRRSNLKKNYTENRRKTKIVDRHRKVQHRKPEAVTHTPNQKPPTKTENRSRHPTTTITLCLSRSIRVCCWCLCLFLPFFSLPACPALLPNQNSP